MGFTSWDCPGCNHSVRHSGATNETSAWMAKAVLVTRHGTIHGAYDGYGVLTSPSGMTTDLGEMSVDPCLYHEACWLASGQPKFKRPSEPSRDQGHFVGEYDPAEPKTVADLVDLVRAEDDRTRAERIKTEGFLARKRAELVAKGEAVPTWLQARP